MNDINDIFIIDDSDVSFKVEEILTIAAESFLYLLKLSILLCIDEL
jgi:hypothetical protein